MSEHDLPVFLLVHSPLAGASTWMRVADGLRQQGQDALVAWLDDCGDNAALPYWQQHAKSGARAVSGLAADRRLILVGHSGAGPLLPAIARAACRPVAGYLFVDAGLPAGRAGRLDLLEQEAPELAAQLRAHLLASGRYPEWSDEALRASVPDAAIRAQVLSELRPRGLDFWQEPLPEVAGWPDVPCGYLQFTTSYDVPAAQARGLDWPVRRLEGGHFLMMLAPELVAGCLIELAGSAGMLNGA